MGLPFSEAIDMWSLGGVLAAMILGYVLFPGRDEYEAVSHYYTLHSLTTVLLHVLFLKGQPQSVM